MSRLRRGVERAGREHNRLDVLVKGLRLHQRILAIGGEPAVGGGASQHPLLGRSAMGPHVEYLRPRHCDLHRSFQYARAQRRQRRLEIVRQLAAEPAADITGDNAHILLTDVEGVRQAFLRACRQLRRGVHGELRAVPHRHGRVQLYGRLILIWRGVRQIDLNWGVGERAVEITDRTVGRIAVADLARIDGGGTSRVQIISAAPWRIVDAHHSGSRGGLLECICDDEGNGKTEIRHVVIVECWHGARETVRQIDRAERMLGAAHCPW